MSEDDSVSKPSRRGGKRPNSGPSRTHAWIEIGELLYKNLKEYCALREYMGFDRVTPEDFLTAVCIDRIDSPSFNKSLERLRAAKRMKDAGEDISDDF